MGGGHFSLVLLFSVLDLICLDRNRHYFLEATHFWVLMWTWCITITLKFFFLEVHVFKKNVFLSFSDKANLVIWSQSLLASATRSDNDSTNLTLPAPLFKYPHSKMAMLMTWRSPIMVPQSHQGTVSEAAPWPFQPIPIQFASDSLSCSEYSSSPMKWQIHPWHQQLTQHFGCAWWCHSQPWCQHHTFGENCGQSSPPRWAWTQWFWIHCGFRLT